MISGFGHSSFNVDSVGDAVEFWTKILGFKFSSDDTYSDEWVEKMTGVEGASVRIAHVLGFGQDIEFVQYISPTPSGTRPSIESPGAAHVCLLVDDMEQAHEELIAKGAAKQGEIIDFKDGGKIVARAAYIVDPNGIRIELLQS